MLKYLRIAVTALCLTACVLLVGLWVQSYQVPFRLIGPNTAKTAAIGIISSRGRLIIGRFDLRKLDAIPPSSEVNSMLAADPQFAMLNQQLNQVKEDLFDIADRPPNGTDFQRMVTIEREIAQYRGQVVTQMMSQRQAVPHWLLLVVAATFAVAPWLRCHFSVRTLLIATTLVAAVLGLIVLSS